MRPFEDGSFDVVFAHALMEHLPRPDTVLAEMRRVLRPGGVIGLRSPDWGGFVLQPYPEPVREAILAYRAQMRANGGDVFAGRKLPSLLAAAGFRDVRPTASYEIYRDASAIAGYLALQLDRADAKSASTLRRWAEEPDAMFAQAWFEAVAFR